MFISSWNYTVSTLVDAELHALSAIHTDASNLIIISYPPGSVNSTVQE